MDKLALEYLQTAERLRARIQTLQRQRAATRGEEHFALERRIDTLRDEYYHLRSVARHLQRGAAHRAERGDRL